MDHPLAHHPSTRSLQAFAHGKLSDGDAQLVLAHLSTCTPCRDRVTAHAGDSFLGGLQSAHAAATGTPVPAKPVPQLIPTPDAAPVAAVHVPGLPAELAANANYRVLRELGRGGMGVVYLAHDRMMDRKVVLKVLGGEYAERPDTCMRFLAEMRAAAKLDHPNVVKAHTCLQLGRLIVFVMEYVDGEDLNRHVKGRGPLGAAIACRYAYQAALGLQHAHEKGMVHRDIKPHNLILSGGKRPAVKILDFGLAKANRENSRDTGLTAEGQMLGTPDYVAPEQTLDAAAVTIRADIYSLGCTLFYLLTGGPPFTGKTVFEVIYAHNTADVRPVVDSRPEIPDALRDVLCRMMAKDPAARPETPAEVARDLMPFFKEGSSGGARALSGGDAGAPAGSGEIKVFDAGMLPPPRRVAQEDCEESREDTDAAYTYPVVSTPRKRNLVLILLMAALIVGMAVAFVVVLVNLPKPNFPVPKPTVRGDAAKKRGPQHAALPARGAAEWVLDHGGTVWIDDDAEQIRKIERLPAGDFKLVKASLSACRGVNKLSALEGITELSVLNLSETQIGDDCAACLTGLTGLTELNLRKTRMTDAGVRSLVSLPILRELDVTDCDVSMDTVVQLREALTGCHILPEVHAAWRTSGPSRPQSRTPEPTSFVSGTAGGNG